ncbi:MAG: right-handed parallel beta-helix repeat-containing protein, partial [Clostridia bacterium]|nr:right-handed parallel beta-helix repeat-containing protein [Clostridia bacterium]
RELDIPGEWYIDSEALKLYYYMPSGLNADDSLEIAVSSNPVIQASNVSDIVFDNLTVKGSRGTLVKLNNTDNITVRNSIIEDGRYGVVLTGRNNVIEGNAIRYTRANAIYVDSGADAETLTASANRISSNHIYNCAHYGSSGTNYDAAVIRLSYETTIDLIGEVVENNLIHGNPYGQAIQYSGMDHKIRYNELYNVTRYMSDVGVIYTGRRLNQYGTEISYNYIHDFSHLLHDTPPADSAAIYWDDWQSGQIAENNIIVADGKEGTRGLLEVGKNNTAKNNIVVNAEMGMRFTDRGNSTFNDEESAAATSAYNSFNYVTDAVNERYPQILQSKADIDKGTGTYTKNFEPTGNYSYGNMHVDVENTTNGTTVFKEAGSNTYTFNLTTSAASGSATTDSNNNTTAKIAGGYNDIFADSDNHDWRLKDSFVSQYTGKLSEGLITQSNFDMDLIGLTSIWDSRVEDKSFELMYPAGRSVKSDGDVTLAWSKALYADRYKYEVSDTADFSNILVQGTTMENAVDITLTEINKQYYWRVTAYNDSKEMGGSWSAQQSYSSFYLGYPDYEIEDAVFFDSNDEELEPAEELSSASYMTYSFVNRTDETKNYELIVALYNADCTNLKKVLAHEKDCSASVGTSSCSIDITPPAECEEGDIVYIFMWDGNEFLKPIAKKTIIR